MSQKPARLHAAIDACSDVTWGWSYDETMANFVRLVAAHLDLMRGDEEHCYNCSVLLELLAFLEAHPERKEEAASRLREGRLYASPFLNNTLYGLQSVESQWRSLWHARQLERELGISLFFAGQHIEMPSLPLSAAEVLPACGMTWLNVPYLPYMGALEGIETPPFFAFISPSGRRLKVCMDRQASVEGAYWQAARALESPQVLAEWAARSPSGLGLASGYHSDTHDDTWTKVAAVRDRIKEAGSWVDGVQVVNSTYARFFAEKDAEGGPLPEVQGSFGCSWEAWTASLAMVLAEAREAERALITAEAALARAILADPRLAGRTAPDRERATWLTAMLADHAWNGYDDQSRAENLRLRREWAAELMAAAGRIGEAAGPSIPAAPPLGEPASRPDWLPAGFAEPAHVSESAAPAPGFELNWHAEGRLEVVASRPAHALAELAVLRLPSTGGGTLVLETGGALERPAQSLLPGSDRRLMAFQHLAAWEGSAGRLLIASPDAAVWRMDHDGIALFGSDTNPVEVSRDQGGETRLVFRFAFRWAEEAWTWADCVNWARAAFWPGALPGDALGIDPSRAVVLGLRPSDEGPEGSAVVRLWELAGRTGPLPLNPPGWTKATKVDLLERKLGPAVALPASVDLSAWQTAAWRLEP